MEAVIDQPLAHVASLYAILRLNLVGEDDFVQGRALERQLERVGKLRAKAEELNWILAELVPRSSPHEKGCLVMRLKLRMDLP